MMRRRAPQLLYLKKVVLKSQKEVSDRSRRLHQPRREDGGARKRRSGRVFHQQAVSRFSLQKARAKPPRPSSAKRPITGKTSAARMVLP
jgi:hypothetical protein